MRVGRARRRRGATGRIVNDDVSTLEGFIWDGASALYPLFSFFWLAGLDGRSVLVVRIPEFSFVSVPTLGYVHGFDIAEQARIQDLLLSFRTSGSCKEWILSSDAKRDIT